MAHVANGGGDDQVDLGMSCFREGEGKLHCAARRYSCIAVADVDAYRPVAESIGEGDEIERSDEGELLNRMELPGKAEARNRGKLEERSDSGVTGGDMGGDEATAGEAGDRDAIGRGELLLDDVMDRARDLFEKGG